MAPRSSRPPAGASRHQAPEPLLTVDEVAGILKVATKTVRREIKRGELPAVRIGRQLRISADDLVLYIRRRQIGP